VNEGLKAVLPKQSKMEQDLVGQESIYTTLDSILKDPPHLFFTGAFGYGKTSMAEAFLKSYFQQFGLDWQDPEWVLNLSSDSDRGIHRVREGVAEFVRHTSSKPGIYRWILCDDSDTLPIVSQQALRRPMETHAHTTRFLFCSRHVSDLIAPLRSRCLHIEIETVSIHDVFDRFKKRLQLENILSEKTETFLMMISVSPRHLLQYLKCIVALGDKFDEEMFHTLFSGASDDRIRCLLVSMLKHDKLAAMHLLFDIWNSGISYEDFLTELFRCSKTMGFLPPKQDQKLHELMIQGWIYYTHGRTHFIDQIKVKIS
jgi:DNA polymerase III delta prime subunit